MKKILSIIGLLILVCSSAQAQTVAQDLNGLGMKSELADYLAGILPAGSTLGNNTYLKGRNQANSADISILKVDATDDTVLNADTGDVVKLAINGTTELQINDNGASWPSTTFDFVAQTSDAADSSRITLNGGGAGADVTRGSFLLVTGNENADAGTLTLAAGDTATATMSFVIENAASSFIFKDGGSGNLLTISDAGVITNAKATDFNFSVGLGTIAFQEAVAGTACSGTLTANGATPVVTSTTCATTGSRIFLQRTSAETGTVNAWISAISNGVSFSITSEAADTGTYNWVIFHEAP